MIVSILHLESWTIMMEGGLSTLFGMLFHMELLTTSQRFKLHHLPNKPSIQNTIFTPFICQKLTSSLVIIIIVISTPSSLKWRISLAAYRTPHWQLWPWFAQVWERGFCSTSYYRIFSTKIKWTIFCSKFQTSSSWGNTSNRYTVAFQPSVVQHAHFAYYDDAICRYSETHRV